MRRKLLLLVPALALSLWASTSAPAEAVPDCTCCYCRDFPSSTCRDLRFQVTQDCVYYYFDVCWSTWEPGDPC